MNRKTNLFYLSGIDSNFLTFSNYTEYLTSVFLNTSLKMFMSKFLALNLPFDEDHTPEGLKMYLMCYYENKLTALRDNIENVNDRLYKIKTLNYLLEAIDKFFKTNNEQFDINETAVYIGDITEHDYNGTYADSICIIDFNRYFNWTLNYDDSINVSEENKLVLKKSDKYDLDHLYGWYDELGNDYIPEYDEKRETTDNTEYIYYLKSKLTEISSTAVDVQTGIYMSFNCIIPLFSVYNIDKKIYNTDDKNNASLSIVLSNDNEDTLTSYKDIPYGIWISPYNIELHRDLSTQYAQSWSLVISSKFAPFPYRINSANATQDAYDKIEKYTYAQLLSDQTKLYANFQDALNKIQYLQNKVDNLTHIVEAINIYSNIDDIKLLLSTLNEKIDARVTEQTKDLREMISNLKWKNIG